MANQITNVKSFLESAKQEVTLANELALQEDGLVQEFNKAEKAVQSEKKSLAALIESTISKRRSEITSSFDAELNTTLDKLNKAKSRRQKEKDAKVKHRIGDETADLMKENQDLKHRIKDMFKKDKVPAFCNSDWYYSLFFPSNVGDFLKLLVLFMIFYAAVPLGIYYWIPERRIYHLAIIYLVCIFVFGGIWAIVHNLTKLRHLETLKNCKNLRRTIRNNKKKMVLIKKSIKGESDDSVYALDDFDREIIRIENELNLVRERRQKAIDTFEREIKPAITEELQNASRTAMEKSEAEFANVKAKLEEVSSQRKIKSMFIADTYEGFLGREFLNPDKLDRLIHICEEGEFNSVSEVLEQYRSRNE